MDLNEINKEIEENMPNDSEIGICINKDKNGNIECHYYIQPIMAEGAQKTDSFFWGIKEIINRLKSKS